MRYGHATYLEIFVLYAPFGKPARFCGLDYCLSVVAQAPRVKLYFILGGEK